MAEEDLISLGKLHESFSYKDAEDDAERDIQDRLWFEEALRLEREVDPNFNPGILIKEAQDAGNLTRDPPSLARLFAREVGEFFTKSLPELKDATARGEIGAPFVQAQAELFEFMESPPDFQPRFGEDLPENISPTELRRRISPFTAMADKAMGPPPEGLSVEDRTRHLIIRASLMFDDEEAFRLQKALSTPVPGQDLLTEPVPFLNTAKILRATSQEILKTDEAIARSEGIANLFPTHPKRVANAIAVSATFTAGAIAANIAGGPGAALIFMHQALMATNFAELRDVTDKEGQKLFQDSDAFKKAQGLTAIQLPFATIFPHLIGRKLNAKIIQHKNFLLDMGKFGATNGGTEGVEEIMAILASKDPRRDASDALDILAENKERVLEAVFVGTVSGTLIGVTAESITRLAKQRVTDDVITEEEFEQVIARLEQAQDPTAPPLDLEGIPIGRQLRGPQQTNLLTGRPESLPLPFETVAFQSELEQNRRDFIALPPDIQEQVDTLAQNEFIRDLARDLESKGFDPGLVRNVTERALLETAGLEALSAERLEALTETVTELMRSGVTETRQLSEGRPLPPLEQVPVPVLEGTKAELIDSFETLPEDIRRGILHRGLNESIDNLKKNLEDSFFSKKDVTDIIAAARDAVEQIPELRGRTAGRSEAVVGPAVEGDVFAQPAALPVTGEPEAEIKTEEPIARPEQPLGATETAPAALEPETLPELPSAATLDEAQQARLSATVQQSGVAKVNDPLLTQAVDDAVSDISGEPDLDVDQDVDPAMIVDRNNQDIDASIAEMIATRTRMPDVAENVDQREDLDIAIEELVTVRQEALDPVVIAEAAGVKEMLGLDPAGFEIEEIVENDERKVDDAERAKRNLPHRLGGQQGGVPFSIAADAAVFVPMSILRALSKTMDTFVGLESKGLQDIILDRNSDEAGQEFLQKVHEQTSISKSLAGRLQEDLINAIKILNLNPMVALGLYNDIIRGIIPEISGESALVRAVEGRIPDSELSREELFIVRSIRDLVRKTGIDMEKAGIVQFKSFVGKDGKVSTELVPFKASKDGKVWPRMWTEEGMSVIARGPNTDDFDLLVSAIAVANGMQDTDVAAVLAEATESLVGDVVTGLKRNNVEFSRIWEVMPTHIFRPNGSRVEIIETNPHRFMMKMVLHSSNSAAFAEVFGQFAVPDSLTEIEGLRNRFVEGSDDAIKASKLFDALLRTMNSMPAFMTSRGLLGTTLTPAPGGVAWESFRIAGGITNIMAAGLVSKAIVMNTSEIIGTTIPHLGLARVVRTMWRTKPFTAQRKAAIADVQRMGAVVDNHRDLLLDPERYTASVLNKTAGAIRRGTVLNMMNEAQGSFNAQVAVTMLGDFLDGRGSIGDVVKLTTIARIPEATAKRIVAGEGTEQENEMMVQRISTGMTGENARASERSLLGNSVFYNFNFRYTNYFQTLFRRLDSTAKNVIKTYDAHRANPDDKKLAAEWRASAANGFKVFVGLGAAGAVGTYLSALAIGGLFGVKDRLEQDKDHPIRLLFDALRVSILGGTLATLTNAGIRPQTTDELYSQVAQIAFPLGRLHEFGLYVEGLKYPYKNKSWGERTNTYLRRSAPVLNTWPADQIGIVLGFHIPDQKTQTALSRYWRYRFDKKNGVRPGGAGTLSDRQKARKEFKIGMRRVRDAVIANKDFQEVVVPLLRKAFDFDPTADTVKSMTSSLEGRLLLRVEKRESGEKRVPGAWDEEAKEAFRKEVGKDIFDLLETHDSLLQAVINKLNPDVRVTRPQLPARPPPIPEVLLGPR